MEFFNAIKSVLAAFIGVQKSNNLREDFSKKTAMPFIVAGILMTLLFIIGVYSLVKIALNTVA